MSVGVDENVGASGTSAGLNASGQTQKQNSESSSRTARDTVVNASQQASIDALGRTTLNGAEVSGKRIEVKTGQLEITSPQNTSSYKSTSTQAGGQFSVPIPIPGTVETNAGGGGSYAHQTVRDHYASTEKTLSGFYAGRGGLGIDVSGNTTLNAGVLSSRADRSQNHLTTHHLTANDEHNASAWTATSIGGGASIGTSNLGSTEGILGAVGQGMAANSLGMLGGQRDHNEHSESQSAISGNITVRAQSQSGHYITDVSQADKALENRFDAQKLSNQLEASRIGTQLVGKVVGEVADELGKRHVWGFGDGGYLRTALETGGNAGIAALTGGNVGVAAASTLAGNIAAYRTRQWASNLAAGMTKDLGLQDLYKNAISNVIASGAGAAGGLVAGGGDNSTNALNGAAAASAIQQYNQAAEQREDMKQREKDILESDPEVKKLLMSSPTAKKEIEDLEGQGWKIVSSNNGGGYTDYADKRIFISPNVSSTTAVTVSAISHELGHALHPTDYDAYSKETYISKTLDGEGWATINNIIVANEINKSINDPYNRIDVQGASSYQYVKIYSKYGTNYEGAHEIGKWYADHETTSVNNATYRDYYGASYDHVDIQKEHEINYPKNKQ